MDGITRNDLLENGYMPEVLKIKLSDFILPIGAAILPILGPLYFFMLSILYLFKNKTKFYRLIQEPNFIQDNRYKSGQRQEGFNVRKEYANHKIEATSTERIKYIFVGVLCLLLFIGTGYFQIQFYGGYFA